MYIIIINIRLFSKYDVTNTHIKLIIHVWYAPVDMLAAPQKLYGQPHYFQILSTFSYNFLLAISQLTPYGGGLRQLTFYDYMIHLITDLKWIINCYG